MSTTQTNATVIPTTTTVADIICGKFSGMLSGFQKVVFRDMKFAGFTPEVSHKIAMDYASQLGNAMRNDDNVRSKVGKANDSGVARMSGSFYDKLLMHNSMALVRIVQSQADLVKEKLLISYALNMDALSERLSEYVVECEEWTLAQTWVHEKEKK